MKKLTTAGILGLGCALALGAAAHETKTTGHKTGGATKRVTGCLERGGDANTYKLTHVTGSSDWQLIGADESLKMSDHLGHKVEVSGTPLGSAPAGTMELNSDEKGVSSGTGSGAKAAVPKKVSDDEKGVSSGTGSGAKGMKGEKGARQLKVTSLKHVSPTCP
jgi:hypothetical protein